jgi:hypothetical protein
MVSLWQRDIEVGDLLRLLSEKTGLTLSSAPEMRHFAVSAFLRDARLRTVMTALATLYDTRWAYRNAGTPLRREYRLVSNERLRSPFVGDLYHEPERRRLAENRQKREERLRRLALYREALSLGADDVLKRYEESDPWVCTAVLDPAKHPLIAYVVDLPSADREKLMVEGRLAVPTRRLPKGLREHLALWSSGKWGSSVLATHRRDPEYIPRFQTHEVRFDYSFIGLYWYDEGLQLELDIPDEDLHGARLIDMGRGVSRHPEEPHPGEELIRLGYRKRTQEYVAAMERDKLAWQRASAQEARRREQERGDDERDHSGTLPGDSTLSRRLDLFGLEGPLIGPSPILEAAARQCGVSVIVQRDRAMPAWRGVPRELLVGSGQTLGTALGRMHKWMGSDWCWELRDGVLTAGDESDWLWEPANVPADKVAEWQERLRADSTQPLEELATFLGRLDTRELQTLRGKEPRVVYLPLVELRIYGLFTPQQRKLMARPEGLRFAGLTPDQQSMLLAVARRTHPWVEMHELKHTVINTMRRRLSTGAEGMSLIANYHFADAPLDRDVVFTAPLRLAIPARLEYDESAVGD